MMCDLTVGWETPSTLDERHTANVTYYETQSMKEYLSARWPYRTYLFQAIALIYRGGISNQLRVPAKERVDSR